MLKTFVIRSQEQVDRLHAFVGANWKACADRGAFMVIRARDIEDTRTIDQNEKFHAICSDLAKSTLQWAGQRRTAAQWKVLLVSGHTKATDGEVDLVPGLEGEFVNIRESTALMSIKRGSSLIEYALAFCAQNDVDLSG